MDDLELLVPRPRKARTTDDRLPVPETLTRRGEDDAGAAFELLDRELRLLGWPPSAPSEDGLLRLRLDPGAGPDPQGYRLTLTGDGIDLVAPGRPGLFYGVATLVQWLRLHAGKGRRPVVLPGLRIVDRPDFRHRGVMLDVSRDRVPTMATLRRLIDLWASLKINQVQLYTEHTFAYRGHETVWRDASPLVPAEVRELDACCRERFIELVPNQNSFGHFHRWLVHEPYRRLAECPEGIDHPFSFVREPFSLCAIDPGSLELLTDLYDQLLPNFSSRQLNVGLDETLDLGRGRSAAVCAERGKARVYLDFVRRVHELARDRGRRIQMWGDIVLQHPELIDRLPEDVVVLQWGYEHDHPFADEGRRFAASGREHYVCPGTSGWNSFAGRSHNALHNLASAARNGQACGASGYLVTDWGDHGHLQQLVAGQVGYLAGAAFAWNVDSAKRVSKLPVARLLDLHVFRDPGRVAGEVTVGLGNAYLEAGDPPNNGSALFFALVFALTEREAARTAGLRPETLGRALGFIERVVESLGDARMARDDAGVVARELAWTADILRFSCRLNHARHKSGDLASFDGMAAANRRGLASELDRLIETYARLWLERSRPGGRERSVARLARVRDLLVG